MGERGSAVDVVREDGTLSFHDEVLNRAQKDILPRLGAFATAQGFYLAGGTAVALHLGHRRSIDFDWFTQEKVEDPLVLAEQARESGVRVEDVQTAPRTLHAIVSDVRVSFFEYPYGLVASAVWWSEHGIHLASLDDLACMKLAAISQRGSRKDFVDLYAIAIHHKSLEHLLELYRKKYSVNDIGHVLAGLTYFDDAEEEALPVMLSDIPWETVKREIRQWTRALAC